MAAVTVTATVLAGCGGAFGGTSKDLKTQLDEILAVTGNQVFAVTVTADQESSDLNVSVGATVNGSTGYYFIDDGKVSSSTLAHAPAAPVVDVSTFSLDTLTSTAQTAIEKDKTCASAEAYASMTPTGATAMWVECQGSEQLERTPVVDLTTLDGKPFQVPALDLDTADGWSDLDQAATVVFGSPQISQVDYDFDNPNITVVGASTTNAAGQTCEPIIGAQTDQPTNPFPLGCSTNADSSAATFAVGDYGAQTFVDVITGLRNSPVLDTKSLTGIAFFTKDTSVLWKASSDNYGDLLEYRSLLGGTVPKP